MREDLIEQIFNLQEGDLDAFEAVWKKVATFQRERNGVYGRYCNSIDSDLPPYLPIEAFKQVPITTFPADEADKIFKSSGTGGGISSLHYVHDISLYERSLSTHFCRLFGEGPYTLIAHLPHYHAMGASSSLLYMLDYLITHFGDVYSGYSLNNEAILTTAIQQNESKGSPFILFGAAFGLLDLVEDKQFKLPADAIVIETGGMKTYRKEITRSALQAQLAEEFALNESQIWSEYGMCELLSQSYTRGGAVFFPPPWMQFEIMDPENPLKRQAVNKPGALAVIDLANLYSVSAILTQDRAIKKGEGFEVLGRLNGAELRGCNFLLEEM